MVLCLKIYREGGEGGTESSCPGGGWGGGWGESSCPGGGGEVGENLVSQEGRGEGSHIYHILFHIGQGIFHLSN